MRLRFLPHSPPQPPSANTTTTPAALQLWKMLTLLIFPRGANLLQDVKTNNNNNNNHDNRSSNDDDGSNNNKVNTSHEWSQHKIIFNSHFWNNPVIQDGWWCPMTAAAIQPANQPFRLVFFTCVCVPGSRYGWRHQTRMNTRRNNFYCVFLQRLLKPSMFAHRGRPHQHYLLLLNIMMRTKQNKIMKQHENESLIAQSVYF